MSLLKIDRLKRAESWFLVAGLLLGLSDPAAAHPGNLAPYFGAGGTAEWPISLRPSENAPVRVDQLNRIILGARSSSGDLLGALKATAP